MLYFHCIIFLVFDRLLLLYGIVLFYTKKWKTRSPFYFCNFTLLLGSKLRKKPESQKQAWIINVKLLTGPYWAWLQRSFLWDALFLCRHLSPLRCYWFAGDWYLLHMSFAVAITGPMAITAISIAMPIRAIAWLTEKQEHHLIIIQLSPAMFTSIVLTNVLTAIRFSQATSFSWSKRFTFKWNSDGKIPYHPWDVLKQFWKHSFVSNFDVGLFGCTILVEVFNENS